MITTKLNNFTNWSKDIRKMKIFSEKIKYSISAIFELAKHYLKGSPLHLKDIAQSQNIPGSYLLQLLNKLKGKGIVTSIRGSHGGYKLAKPPDEIKILDIIYALERVLLGL